MTAFSVTECAVQCSIYGLVLVYCIVNFVLFLRTRARAKRSALTFQTFGEICLILSLCLRIAWVAMKTEGIDNEPSDFTVNRLSLLLNYDGLNIYIHLWLGIRLQMTTHESRQRLVATHAGLGVIDVFVNILMIVYIVLFTVNHDGPYEEKDDNYQTSMLIISSIEFYLCVLFIVVGSVLISRMRQWNDFINNYKEETNWFIASSVISCVSCFIRGLFLSWYKMFGHELTQTYPWLPYVVPDCLVCIILSLDMARVKRWRRQRQDSHILADFDESSVV